MLIVFICATLSMQYHTADFSLVDCLSVLPLALVAIYYSEELAYLVKLPDHGQKKSTLFRRDLFLLNFSFLLGCLLSFILSYNNSDVKGWWTLIIYLITLYGFIFSIVFSAIAILIENHKNYTIAFSILIIVLLSIGNFFPHYISIPLLGKIDTSYVITCLLLIFHLLFSINYKIVRLLLHKKNTLQK